MKRRHFLKKTAIASAGAFAAPYILPSGRLFAQTGSQMAKHVVLVMFAGGVRNQESVEKLYLRTSQYPFTQDPDLAALEGNIMPNLLSGEAPIDKIVYGGGTNGQTPIAPILGTPIDQQGVLFRELICGSAGHYNGLVGLISGNYSSTQGLREKPVSPTIFEYIRRFMDPSNEGTATKVWFIGNRLGNSIPLLNYSQHPDFGAKYGANFFCPTVTFGDDGRRFLAAARNYHPEEDFSKIYEMRNFLNNSFLTTGGMLESLGNTPEEKYEIKQFMKKMFDADFETIMQFVPESPEAGINPEVTPIINQDVSSLVYATEVMDYFEPTITVVNLDGPDVCHGDFTKYLSSLHRADYAMGYLWNFIQNHPTFSNETIMLVAPECGRNFEPNSIQDGNEWYAYDHSDQNAHRGWAAMVGKNVPAGLTLTGNATGGTHPDGTPKYSPLGSTAQVVMTIADILGIRGSVQSAGYLPGMNSLFDLL